MGAVVTVIDQNQWLSTPLLKLPGVAVLALESQDHSHTQIIASILRCPTSPFLLLIAQPITKPDKEIIALCKEYCIWPCNPLELEFKLGLIKSGNTQDNEYRAELLNTESWMKMNLVGCSASFQKVLAIIKNSACCDAPVLIEGETGTGKEMVSRAIHYLGVRQNHPFIPVNCGAIPDHLVENEFFGHEKGAYTDAIQSQTGLIVQAEGGTLFLDEIEALSVKGQVILLRFIEDHVVKPLGTKHTKVVDVRIIAASNTPLVELVEKQQFRQDLLFRLNLISVSLPPLRERPVDIQQLIEFFMQKYRSQYQQPEKLIDPVTINRLVKHSWPGNVRELENFIHRAFLLSSDSWISQLEALEQYEHSNDIETLSCQDFDEPFNEAKAKAIKVFEARYLTRLISNTKGNVTKAASSAQKERRALGKLLKKHHIDPEQYRNP